jgi:predicted CoA-binding protein
MADELLSMAVNIHAASSGDIIARARSAGRSFLDEAAGKALLSRFGIRTPRSVLVRDANEAAARALELEAPFVVKVVSPDILHKSDAGGVALGLSDAAAVRAAVESIAAGPGLAGARIDGWLVEEMARPGHEVVVGGVRDPQFGPMIMVGLGGIFVEVLKDVSFRICPIDAADAHAMLDELKGRALLAGARGQEPADIEALVEILVRVGGADGLVMTLADEIAEADLNPVIVSANGAVAVDARFVLAPEGRPSGGVSAQAAAEDRASPLDTFRPLFEPKSVAVLGASTREVAIANTFIRRMKAFGYPGAIYPIHPKAEEIEGLKAYPSLAEAPEPIDYAYVAIGAKRIPDALAQAKGRCRIAQVISSGFGEVEEGRALEKELVEKARGAGVRVLGPNTLGSYSPRGGLTFPADAPRELGNVGVVSQSGGLSTDIIKRGQWRGLRFSGLVTIGNSADIKPHELVEYYVDDPRNRALSGGREGRLCVRRPSALSARAQASGHPQGWPIKAGPDGRGLAHRGSGGGRQGVGGPCAAVPGSPRADDRRFHRHIARLAAFQLEARTADTKNHALWQWRRLQRAGRRRLRRRRPRRVAL